MSKRYGPFARMSLRHKLPLVAAGLIALVGAAISTASYLQVRHTALAAAYQHIGDLVQLVGAGQRTGAQVLAAARRMSARPAIVAFATAPTATHRAAALAAIDEPPNPNVVGTTIRDRSGQLLLTTNSKLDHEGSDFPPAVAGVGDSGVVGRIQQIDDSLVYSTSVPIPGAPGATLVQWRRITVTADANRKTQQAIGAVVLMGNLDGSYWTDLTRVVRAPPLNAINAKAPTEYTRDPRDGVVLGQLMPIAETPWVFAAEIPVATFMAPAETFFRRILVVTLACVLLGALAAWWFALSVTTPLLALTEAADAMAAGKRPGPIDVARTDELGRLAISFGAMTDQVQDGLQRMEERVVERTLALNQTVRQLQDAQESLVRREKLAMLGQVGAGVAHELRNPLGVMSNAVYYLDVVLASSPAEVRDYLRILREQVTLSTRIVTDLLDSGRIAPAHKRPTDLGAVIDEQVRRLAHPASVQLEVDVRDVPPVDVDPLHIGQVVFNLLTNAVQAIGEQPGHIRIQASTRGVDDVVLRISDDGSGMKPEVIDRIFEPLFTTRARGIGLGLSISRALVQANGGEISVSSAPGRGTTFTVVLPAAIGVIA